MVLVSVPNNWNEVVKLTYEHCVTVVVSSSSQDIVYRNCRIFVFEHKKTFTVLYLSRYLLIIGYTAISWMVVERPKFRGEVRTVKQGRASCVFACTGATRSTVRRIFSKRWHSITIQLWRFREVRFYVLMMKKIFFNILIPNIKCWRVPNRVIFFWGYGWLQYHNLQHWMRWKLIDIIQIIVDIDTYLNRLQVLK